MGDHFPYDRSFKLLADNDPRAVLAAFAGIPLSADLDVRAADRELVQRKLQVDYLYICRRGNEEFLVHFEAVSRYRKEVLERQAEYVRAIIVKYGLPCRSYLLLFTHEGVPEHLPPRLESRLGDYRWSMRLRVIRLWTVPAQRVLRLGRPALLPWTVLMRASEEDLLEAARRVAAAENGRLLSADMAVLLGLRYGKTELFEEKLTHMTTEEIIRDSYFFRWAEEKGFERGERVGLEKGERVGLEKGERVGLEKGELRAERKALSRLLVARFGALPPWAEERLAAAHVATLDEWMLNVLTANSLDDCLRQG